MSTQMRLDFAGRLATRIVAELAPLCERIEVAGSIRRRRPMVGDIDLVALPLQGGAEAFRARVKRSARVAVDGQQNLIVELANGVQVDVFIARRKSVPDLFGAQVRGNFGSLLLCRTGSREHNIYVAQRALAEGWKWDPYAGLFDGAGHWLAGEWEEREIFERLGMGWIEPERRER
jgi:DNA polymerase (family X)